MMSRALTWRSERPPLRGVPASRRCVRIWKSRHFRMWLWECSFCEPPTRGYRTQRGALEKIITISLPHHFRRLDQHHKHVGMRSR